jgi:hypothetical protein
MLLEATGFAVGGLALLAGYYYVLTIDIEFLKGIAFGFILCLVAEISGVIAYLRWRILKN